MAARHFFVQSDKETKQRKRFNRSTLSVHSVQFPFIGAPKARCSPELRMCETLLLANPDTNTLRPVRSRASTLAKEPAPLYACLRLQFFWINYLVRAAMVIDHGSTSSSLTRVCCLSFGELVTRFVRSSQGLRVTGYGLRLTAYAPLRPHFEVGWRYDSSCVQIWRMVVRG